MADLAKPRVAQSEPVAEPAVKSDPQVTVGSKEPIEQFSTYKLDHHVPYTAKYYGLPNEAQFTDSPYADEVDTIENYLLSEVESGRLDNSTSSIKKRLESLERIAGVEEYFPTAQKTKLLVKYIKELKKLGDIGSPLVL